MRMKKTSQGAVVAAQGVLRFSLGFAVLTTLLLVADMPVLSSAIPSAIVGMVLLLALLGIFPWLAPAVESPSMLLLKHMMLFFIPAVVGVIDQFSVLSKGWIPFVIASVVGAALTLAVTAVTLQWLLRRQKLRP